jgi:flagellar hook-associated protein 3 FlgL
MSDTRIIEALRSGETMRISNYILQQRALRGLGLNLDSLARAQEEAATGRRIRTVSDDPVDASQVMRLDAQLRDVEQYRRNATAANTRLSTEDVVLTTARELMGRARGLALSGATQSPSDPLRQEALSELQRIREQLVSLGNTRLGNEYIFGGGVTTNAPFLPDGSYVGDTTVRQAAIDDGVLVDTNHTGGALFGSAFQALDALANELQTGTPTTIQAQATDISTAEQDLLSSQADVGSRMREVDAAMQHLTSRATTYSDQRDGLRDADPSESVVKVVAAQTALERAYAVVGRILSNNIVDYLR